MILINLKKVQFFYIKIICLFLLLFTLCNNTVLANDKEFETKAKYAILLDYNNFEILFSTTNINEPATPSSMTKIMTAYIIFDMLKNNQFKLEDKIKVSIRAWRQEGARTFLEPDKPVDLDTLLRGLIIQSGNDSAVALAEGACGTIDGFVEKMNLKAKELGLKNTHYINPTGLYHKNHYMSVYDVALLSYSLIKNHKDFYDEYFSQKSFTYSKISQRNRNDLLFEYEGADGIKTGHTDVGGFSLSSSVEKHGQRFIAVVNGCNNERERARESKKLFDYAFKQYQYIELYKSGEIVDTLDVKNGSKNFINVYTKQDITYSTKKEQMPNIIVEKIYKNNLVAPIEKDQIIGYIKITDGEKLSYFDLLAKNEVEYESFFNKIKNKVASLF